LYVLNLHQTKEFGENDHPINEYYLPKTLLYFRTMCLSPILIEHRLLNICAQNTDYVEMFLNSVLTLCIELVPQNLWPIKNFLDKNQ